MVWRSRIVAVAVLILLLSLAVAGSAHADTVYSEGTISTTYIEYAKGIVNGISPSQSYVFFRSGQYTYDLIVSDNLKCENGHFVADDFVRYNWNTGSGYNSVPTFRSTVGSVFDMNAGNVMVYSNLSGYPSLEERGSIYAEITAILVAVMLLGHIIEHVFNAVSSLRR